MGEFDQIDVLDAQFENAVQCQRQTCFDSGRTRHTCTDRNIAAEDAVESADLPVRRQKLLDDSHEIIRPAFLGTPDIKERKLKIIVEIAGDESAFRVLPRDDCNRDCLINGGRQDKSLIVIRMLTD